MFSSANAPVRAASNNPTALAAPFGGVLVVGALVAAALAG
jgi:hypothetical protein